MSDPDIDNQFGRTIGAIAWTCNVAIEELSDEQRVVFFQRIMAGYCRQCGIKNPKRCNCTVYGKGQ